MYSKGRGWRYIQANFCIPAIWSDDLLPTTHIAARSYSGQIRVHHGKYNDVKMLYFIRSPARTNIKVGSLRPTRTKFLFTLVTKCRQQKMDPEGAFAFHFLDGRRGFVLRVAGATKLRHEWRNSLLLVLIGVHGPAFWRSTWG